MGTRSESVTETRERASTDGQDVAGQVVQQAQETAGQAMGRAREQATSVAATQKDKLSQNLATVAQALRQTGQQLDAQGQVTAGQLADKAAIQLEGVAGYLSGRDINQIVGEAESFARRQPGLFLGSAFALGFLASRFLKSSAPTEVADGTTI